VTTPALPAIPGSGQVTAWQAGYAGPAGPRTAMLLLLQVSWLRWHLYSDLLKNQVDDIRGAADPASGLVGHRLGFSKDGVYETGEEIRALAALDADERDRCARLAKMAHDAGIMDSSW
jgi:hypothetical protein